jgi:hypothetical protein
VNDGLLGMKLGHGYFIKCLERVASRGCLAIYGRLPPTRQNSADQCAMFLADAQRTAGIWRANAKEEVEQ